MKDNGDLSTDGTELANFSPIPMKKLLKAFAIDAVSVNSQLCVLL